MPGMESYDVLIVGGGAAGLSAALVLGRARRRTVVVDAGGQSNRAAHGVGGLLGHDGRPPADLYAMGRAEVTGYGVDVLDGEVLTIDDDPDSDGAAGFVARLADGRTLHAARVLLTVGMRYDPPAIDGLDRHWGGQVFHCPFCHGWEVRDRALAVLDPSEFGPMRARLLRGWSDDVTLLSPNVDAETTAALAADGITVDTRAVTGLAEDDDGALVGVTLDDGTTLPVGGLLVGSPLRRRDDLVTALDLAIAPASPLTDEAIQVDAMAHTSRPGIYAAGDVTGAMPSVAGVIAAGHTAAASIVHDLLVG